MKSSLTPGALRLLVLACAFSVYCTPPPKVFLDSPADGAFVNAASTLVTGHLQDIGAAAATVSINGTNVPINPDGTFSTTVALSATAVFNPVLVELRGTSGTLLDRKRQSIIRGASVADGAFSDKGVAMRINDTGLDQLEPTVQSLVLSGFNPATLLPPGTLLTTIFQCIIPNPFGGCITGVTIRAYADGISTGAIGIGLDITATPNTTQARVTVDNLRADYYTTGISCTGYITANTTTITGQYDQQPGVPTNSIDVNQSGAVAVAFTAFNNTFDGGICDFPIIGDIISAIIGNVQPQVQSGLVAALGDPDGAGPADSPIASAIQTALDGIQLAGPIGSGLGVNFQANFDTIVEEDEAGTNDGITYKVDGAITSDGPYPTGAPNLTASYATNAPLPDYGPTNPGPVPAPQNYGIGLGVSPDVFNQLLKAQTEEGLLLTTITEIDLDPAHPPGPAPLTAGLLSLFIPEFAALDPTMPLQINLKPTTSPLLTGNPGPSGEIGDLRVGNLSAEIFPTAFVDTVSLLKVGVDARTGFTLGYDAPNSALLFNIVPPLAGDITVGIIKNPYNTDEVALTSLLQTLIGLLLPQLASSLGSFPLPSFLGLTLTPVQITTNGQFLTIYANLTP